MLTRALTRNAELDEAIATGGRVVVADHSSRRETWLVRTDSAAYLHTGSGSEPIDSGGLTLRAAAARMHPFSPGIAASLGCAVADAHTPTATDPARLPGPLPWAFRLGAPGARFLHQASAANRQLVVELQRSPGLPDQLAALPAAWSPGCTIHNDLKWDNVIVYPAAGHAGAARVELIDWELAGVGDPCWDVGTLLSEFVACWALSIPVAGGEPHEALAKYPIEAMQPAIRAFWAGYVETMDLDLATARERLIVSLRFAGARLIQTAYERAQTLAHLTPHSYLLLQLAQNIMEQPEDAAGGLFGIALPGQVEA